MTIASRGSRCMLAVAAAISFMLSLTEPASALLCGTIANPVLVVPSALAFGFYDPLSGNDDATNATISVSCSVQLLSTLPSFTIALSAGGAGSFSPRQLSLAGTGILNYNIYTGPGLGAIWGDATGATVTRPYTSSAGVAAASFTAYGNVPKHQYAGAGSYGDTITVTVTY